MSANASSRLSLTRAFSAWRLRLRRAASRPEYVRSVAYAVPLFFGAFVVNVIAVQFATDHASNAVSDLVLSNTPVFNVDDFFVYGTWVFALFAIVVVIAQPKCIPFALKSLALFWFIRSGFTSLTHIAPFNPQAISDFGPTINRMFFGADRFFSGHVGMTFLGALAYWHKPWIRNTFLGASLFFAVIVLLGHLHYSIDVAAAFFITYTIFHMSEYLFPGDRALFYSEGSAPSL